MVTYDKVERFFLFLSLLWSLAAVTTFGLSEHIFCKTNPRGECFYDLSFQTSVPNTMWDDIVGFTFYLGVCSVTLQLPAKTLWYSIARNWATCNWRVCRSDLRCVGERDCTMALGGCPIYSENVLVLFNWLNCELWSSQLSWSIDRSVSMISNLTEICFVCVSGLMNGLFLD